MTLITHGSTEDFTCPEARTWGWGSHPGGLFNKLIRPLVRVSVNWEKGDSIMYIIYIWLYARGEREPVIVLESW